MHSRVRGRGPKSPESGEAAMKKTTRVAVQNALAELIEKECPKGGSHTFKGGACSKCHEPQPAKAKPSKPEAKAKPAKAKASKAKPERKLSLLTAAHQVLSGAKDPMGTKEMIEAVTANGLWSSPAGKTPHATLQAAIIREIAGKGPESRFAKVGPGKFLAK